MSDKTLRKLILIIIAALIIHQMGTMIAGLFGWIWGGFTALLVAVISFFSVRMAKANSTGALWYMLPTLLFTLLPIGWMIWRGYHQDEVSLLERLLGFSSFLIGFVIPVVLLLLIYLQLFKRKS